MNYAEMFDVSWWQFAVRVDGVTARELKDAGELIVGEFWLDFGRLDFDAARSDGMHAVICRAGRGKGIDETFQLSIDAAKDADLLVSGYWYLYVDQGLQVQKFVEQIQAVGGVHFPLVLDVERYGNEDATPAEWQACINQNVKYLEDAGFEVMLYSSRWMWKITGNMSKINGKPADSYLIWTAHWIDVDPTSVVPFLPSPWEAKRQWEMWQKGSDYRPDRYVDRLDWGIANYTPEALRAKYAGEPIPDPPPNGDLEKQVEKNEQDIIKLQLEVVALGVLNAASHEVYHDN